MLIEVKVPALSESVAEATLLTWHKKAGDYVKRDENLIDIETDKVVLELPSPESGVLKEIVKQDGVSVAANEVIARIDTSVEVADEAVSSVSVPEVVDKKDLAAAVVVMPAARKIAAENGLQISSIQGTGRGGRVTKSDIQLAVQKKDVPAAAQTNNVVNFSAASEDGRVSQRVPMSRLRKRVAERLLQSQASAAILTTFNEVNMQPVIDIRNRYKSQFEKEHGVKLGFMSFFCKSGSGSAQEISDCECIGRWG